MASNTPSQGDGQFSFAKIAAMPAPSHPQTSSASGESDDAQPAQSSTYSETSNTGVPLPDSHLCTSNQEHTLSSPSVDDLGRAVQDIDLALQKDHDGSGSSLDGQVNGLLNRENSFEDDRTHLSNSSTKMTNFDSKSLASVTTFAMDEKDSVRPDDSASVQAIDEEESLSGPASGAPNSVTGSEAGGRAFRDGIPPRPRGILPAPGPLYNGGNQRGPVAIPPDSVSNNFVVPISPGNLPDAHSLHGFPLEPDEKLLEAMKSPKDRLLILQLEDKIRHFIKDSSEQSLELPPSNAFGRLLAHKLGDYYHLTHFVDNNVTSVRLHRTPFCRMSTPLSAIHAATSATPPPSVPAMKIMRRSDGGRPSTEGSTAPSSSAPSKNPSEAGDSGPEGDRALSSKDRMALTREEREVKYHEARERIFRDFPDSAKSDSAAGDSNPDLSRSSSTNGRKKNQQRQRTPHDDSFEVRSQFNAYYPGMQYNNHNNGRSGQYTNAPTNDGSFPSQVPYLVGPGVSPPAGGYVPPGQNGAMYPGTMGMNNVPQYPMVATPPQMAGNGPWQGGNMPQQSPYSGYASLNQAGMMSSQSSTKSSPSMNTYAVPHPAQYPQNPGWNPQPYAGNFPQPQMQRNQPPAHWPRYPSQSMNPSLAMHPYAQYPGQHLNQGYQHHAGPQAMAGGLDRSHFNPQTRSFVPGGPPPARHPMQPYTSMPPSVPSQWNGYPDPNQVPMGNMVRGPHANSRDSIAKWGTPSHLPPKPPPSEVPAEFDLKNRPGPAVVSTPISPAPCPTNRGAPVPNNGPFVVSGSTTTPQTN